MFGKFSRLFFFQVACITELKKILLLNNIMASQKYNQFIMAITVTDLINARGAYLILGVQAGAFNR